MTISLLQRLGMKLAKKQIKQLKLEVKLLRNLVEGYLDSPTAGSNHEKALNGQIGRRAIIEDLLSAFHFDFIAETGTHLGHSTSYFAAKTQHPVYTSELDPHYSGIATLRLANFENIHIFLSDSRKMLRHLASLDNCNNKLGFFYLDAHFFDDLPLLEEIQIVADNWSQFVILVDDFEVPGDKGYGYDNYGCNGKLSYEYIQPLVKRISLSTWAPILPSAQESGYCRGCAVITRSGLSTQIDNLSTLRRIS